VLRVPLAILAAVAIGSCAPYPQAPPVAVQQASIGDTVGLIAAEPPSTATTFPGLLAVVGYGVAGVATTIDAVLVGAGPP